MAIMQDIKLMDAAQIKLPVDGFASLDNLAEKLDDILQGKAPSSALTKKSASIRIW